MAGPSFFVGDEDNEPKSSMLCEIEVLNNTLTYQASIKPSGSRRDEEVQIKEEIEDWTCTGCHELITASQNGILTKPAGYNWR